MSQKYDVVVTTPKYYRTGKAGITYKGETATAWLEVEDFGRFEATGTRDDKNFEISGTADVIDVGPVEFTAKGQTWGSSLDCTAETSIGTVTIYGTETSVSAGDTNGVSSGYFAGRWADGC